MIHSRIRPQTPCPHRFHHILRLGNIARVWDRIQSDAYIRIPSRMNRSFEKAPHKFRPRVFAGSVCQDYKVRNGHDVQQQSVFLVRNVDLHDDSMSSNSRLSTARSFNNADNPLKPVCISEAYLSESIDCSQTLLWWSAQPIRQIALCGRRIFKVIFIDNLLSHGPILLL